MRGIDQYPGVAKVTTRVVWLLLHVGLGASYLHGFFGGVLGLSGERFARLRAGTWVMAGVAWLTAITGTFVILPWYRAPAPAGTSAGALAAYPRAWLLAHPDLAHWHRFGMEWKEHIGWLSPMLATAVAYVVVRHGELIAREPAVRRTLLVLFVLAFVTAAVAGVYGVLLNKVAPNQFLRG